MNDWVTSADESWPPTLGGGWHHMGTTRMHADPKQGVVDATCRVHGVGNLSIAGASVYPTAGSANPTLTLVALSLRLSDHLRKSLG
jgi:choline dehydrogenase-like flavoprotein